MPIRYDIKLSQIVKGANLLPIRLVLMSDAAISDTSAIAHYYYRLAQRVHENGGNITLYSIHRPPNQIIAKFRRIGANITFQDKKKESRLHGSLRTVMDGFNLSYRFRPDVLIGHFSVCGNAAAIVGKCLHIPSIKFVHTLSDAHLISKGLRRVNAFHRYKRTALASLASRIVAVSKAVAEDLKSNYGIAPNRILILKNGVDPEIYRPQKSKQSVRKTLNIPNDAKVLIMVAGFTPEKAHEILIQSMAQLAKPSTYLILAGGGALSEKIRSLAKQVGIDGQVRFLGIRDDVPDLLGASDIAVLPSLSEAFPFFILEAMSVGLPVIGSNVGGIPELIADKKTGLLVPPADTKALTDAILLLLLDPRRAERMGRAGANTVREEFDLNRRVDAEIGLYREILGRKLHSIN